MFCPNCGARIPDGSKFCTACGAVLGASASSADVTQLQPTQVAPRPVSQPYEQRANQPIPPVAPSPDQQLASAPQPPKKGGRGKVVAIVVLALLLVAAIAVIVWQVVLPQLNGSRQAAGQPAQEQLAEPESETDPDLDITAPEAPELEPPELTTPESATLEDYLNEAGQYDTMCDLMTESLTQSGGDAVTNAETQVKGNVIEVHVAWNFSSSDSNARAVEDAMIEAYDSSSVADAMATSVEQLESASGISGITIELYLYTSDNVLFGTVAYGADGLATGDASFVGEPLAS